MTSNNLKKKNLINKKPVYISFLKVTGVCKHKTKFIFNLCNSGIYKTCDDLSKINHECNNTVKTYATINVDIFKKNSIQFNIKRLNIIKNK